MGFRCRFRHTALLAPLTIHRTHGGKNSISANVARQERARARISIGGARRDTGQTIGPTWILAKRPWK